MKQVRTPFGKMPMSAEDYADTYDNFMQGYDNKDLVAVFLSGAKLLMSLTATIEAQENTISQLQLDLDLVDGEIRERGSFTSDH